MADVKANGNSENAESTTNGQPARRAVLALDPEAERERDNRSRARVQQDSDEDGEGDEEEEGGEGGEEDGDILEGLPDDTDVRLVLRIHACVRLMHNAHSTGDRARSFTIADPSKSSIA